MIILHIENTTEAIGINAAWLFYIQKQKSHHSQFLGKIGSYL